MVCLPWWRRRKDEGDFETRGPRRVAWGGQGQPEDPRSRIIEAAIRTLTTYGLEHTSLTVIAREAQVSRQTVYKYFFHQGGDRRDRPGAGGHRRRRSSRSARPHCWHRRGIRGGVVPVGGPGVHRQPGHPPMITVLNNRPRVVGCWIRMRWLWPADTWNPSWDIDLTSPGDLKEMTETFLRFVISLMTFEAVRQQRR